jgi:hypothetical protein
LACDSGCPAAVTNRLTVRDGFVISALDTVAHTVYFVEETAMINAQYPDHFGHAVKQETSRLLLGELADDCPMMISRATPPRSAE